MKKKIVFFSLILLIISSCSKADCDNPLDCLPEKTTNGENTFGCIVEGGVFTPSSTGMGGSGLDVYYKNTDDIESLSISAINHKKDNAIYLVIIDDIEADHTYQLSSSKDDSYGLFSENLSYYETFRESSGSVTINKFDRENGIISGEFNFSAKNDSGKIVEVTQGRFDLDL